MAPGTVGDPIESGDADIEAAELARGGEADRDGATIFEETVD